METIFGSFIVQLAVALSIIGVSIGAVDIVGTSIKERRKRKALEARRAHQLLLAEKLTDPVQLMMVDRDLAKDVYAELERQLALKKDDALEELPEAEEPKKKKAQKRLPAGKRRT
ncbi:MAG TPA: hypothetical protein VJ694_01020 [Patescibacteria group bacterium]|nr:hypothetical protein [Patescibacteria group bacterium]